MANVKNYTEQGGEKTVIGGELNIAVGGKLTFGTVEMKPSTKIAAAAGATPTKTEWDALVAALVAAGLMSAT